MNWETLTVASLVLAAIPAALTLLNLRIYRPLPPKSDHEPLLAMSVLIPARDEAGNIGEALAAILANRDAVFEVIVLDDHSTDDTAVMVRKVAEADPRVRLEQAPPLPEGWCGKQHACHVLAGHARHPLLVFVDADVRLAPDALPRMAAAMGRPGAAALASGFPRQILGSFGERLLLPLIHFVLLGYLPMHGMRFSRLAGFSAGCGQLFIARRAAYLQSGGHGKIRASLHDGVKLPRLFRKAGFHTDLFDATDLATCRMYQNGREVLAGLSKNATEGIAAPGTILPMTALLAGGQIFPFIALAASPWLPDEILSLAVIACLLAGFPRLLVMNRFRQPLASALLHPLGVAVLLGIQWVALFRRALGKPSRWKARDYRPAGAAVVFFLSLMPFSPLQAAPEPAKVVPRIELSDQHDKPHRVTFPAAKVTVLSLADRHGREQVAAWVPGLKPFQSQITVHRFADASGTPALMKSMIRRRIRNAYDPRDTILIDWTGAICRKIGCRPGVVNLVIVSRDGTVLHRTSGPATEENRARFSAALKQAIAAGQ
jgi:hypothetical protein